MIQSHSEIVLLSFDEACEAGFEDMPRRLLDILKIQEFVGYRPTLNLYQMLVRAILYERERLEVKAAR